MLQPQCSAIALSVHCSDSITSSAIALHCCGKRYAENRTTISQSEIKLKPATQIARSAKFSSSGLKPESSSYKSYVKKCGKYVKNHYIDIPIMNKFAHKHFLSISKITII